MYMYIINESIEIKISSNCLHVYRHHTSISMKNVIKKLGAISDPISEKSMGYSTGYISGITMIPKMDIFNIINS